jgi:hypothetical protein
VRANDPCGQQACTMTLTTILSVASSGLARWQRFYATCDTAERASTTSASLAIFAFLHALLLYLLCHYKSILQISAGANMLAFSIHTVWAFLSDLSTANNATQGRVFFSHHLSFHLKSTITLLDPMVLARKDTTTTFIRNSHTLFCLRPIEHFRYPKSLVAYSNRQSLFRAQPLVGKTIIQYEQC